jgi:hypothetical protein
MQQSLIVAVAVVGLMTGCGDTDFKGSAGKLHPTITKEFTQDSYPEASTVRQQGHSGDAQGENFEQGEWGKLDVLVVIDNSGSMEQERLELSDKMTVLLSQVEKADWQIGIVTTDQEPYNRVLFKQRMDLIKKGEANAAGRFAQIINGYEDSSNGLEQHFLQTVNALNGTYSDPWVRDGSTVVVVYVSDEDNCSDGDDCAGADANAAHVTDYLSSIRTLGKDAKAYGIYWQPGTTCATGFAQANKLAEVVTATNGKAGSICDADYAPTLSNISKDIAQIIKYEFELGHVPDDGTLKITVDGKDWTDYTLTDKLVKFTKAPAFGAKVDVAYRHGADGTLTDEFELDKVPDAASIQVFVDGKPLPAGSYTWNDAEKRVELTDKPDERAEVTFKYKEAVPLKDTFLVEKGALPNTVAAWVNGERVREITYDVATGNVVFATPPPADAKIKISYKRPKD